MYMHTWSYMESWTWSYMGKRRVVTKHRRVAGCVTCCGRTLISHAYPLSPAIPLGKRYSTRHLITHPATTNQRPENRTSDAPTPCPAPVLPAPMGLASATWCFIRYPMSSMPSDFIRPRRAGECQHMQQDGELWAGCLEACCRPPSDRQSRRARQILVYVRHAAARESSA